MSAADEAWADATAEERCASGYMGGRDDWRDLCRLVAYRPDRDAYIERMAVANVSPAVLVRVLRRQLDEREAS